MSLASFIQGIAGADVDPPFRELLRPGLLGVSTGVLKFGKYEKSQITLEEAVGIDYGKVVSDADSLLRHIRSLSAKYRLNDAGSLRHWDTINESVTPDKPRRP